MFPWSCRLRGAFIHISAAILHESGYVFRKERFPRKNGLLKEHQLLNPRSCRLRDAFHFQAEHTCKEPEACFQARSRAEAQGLTELKASS